MSILTKTIFDKAVLLRKQYYDQKLRIGFCHDVAHLIGYVLQNESHFVNLVMGDCNGCLHTWLEVDGVQIDPSRDCAGQDGAWVYLVNEQEYTVHSVHVFNIRDFYDEINLTMLKDAANEACSFCKNRNLSGGTV